jgi:hypothetical protein
VNHPPRNIVLSLLLAALALSLGLAVGVAPASAKSKPPCWKTLINDWYDGRIDGVYPIHCYREALAHLPADVEVYSSARQDIKEALQKRITQGSGGGTATTQGSGGSSGSGAGPTGNGGGGSNGSGGSQGSGGSSGGSQGNGGSASGGPVGDVFDATKPDSADSVPVPLIVLGAVAFLLMVAGATGFLARRQRMRRVELASAAATQSGSAKPPRPRS